VPQVVELARILADQMIPPDRSTRRWRSLKTTAPPPQPFTQAYAFAEAIAKNFDEAARAASSIVEAHFNVSSCHPCDPLAPQGSFSAQAPPHFFVTVL
jgi:hypothetical protein